MYKTGEYILGQFVVSTTFGDWKSNILSHSSFCLRAVAEHAFIIDDKIQKSVTSSTTSGSQVFPCSAISVRSTCLLPISFAARIILPATSTRSAGVVRRPRAARSSGVRVAVSRRLCTCRKPSGAHIVAALGLVWVSECRHRKIQTKGLT